MSKRKGHKRCKAPDCGEWFKPFNSMQQACSPKCALVFAQSKQGREHVAKEKRKSNQAEKNRILYGENPRWWMSIDKDASRNGGSTAYWCHRFIRLRDHDRGCIMCGSDEPKGGKFDACHYRTRGAASHLRFHPDNIHKGCAHCNTYTNGDTASVYRINLVERIGEDRVVALETDNTPHKWAIEELRELRDYYKAKCKKLEKEMEIAA